MFTMNLMYKYVDFNSDIYLGFVIFDSYHLYIVKQMLCIFTSEGHPYYSLLVKPQLISILLCNH